MKKILLKNTFLSIGFLCGSSLCYAGVGVELNQTDLNTLLQSFSVSDIPNQSPSKTHKLQINDKDNLLGKKEIAFKTRIELKEELNNLLALMLKKGYATSSIVSENGEIKVIAGKVNNVIMQDSSTFFPNLKKKLFGADLDGKILNINDVNEFVARYNKNSTNKLNVSIVNADKKHYSDVVVKNDYHFKITPKLQVKHTKPIKSKQNKSSKTTYNLGLDFEQILGFNDRLNLNANLEKQDRMLSANYSFLVKDVDFSLNYTRYKQKKEQFSGIVLVDKLHRIGMSANTELIKDPDFMVSAYVSLSQENEKEVLKNTLIYDRDFTDAGIGASVLKYFVKDKKIYALEFKPNLNFNLAKQDEPIKRDDSQCLMSRNYTNFNTDYYSLNGFLGYSKLVSGDVMYDKCTYTNKNNDFDSEPLVYDSPFVFYINNTVKYPVKIEKVTLYPFLEFAAGRDVENRETLTGASAGVIFSSNNIGFGTKYSHTKNDRAMSIKLNVQF
ncbi:Uncharacterised protein [Phocoenobacter uteri]|uniref:Haemolysin activator HlyB C-terminal domain-containing protein n=1 Tax=Phocoenobacter uteri TaxID=146806 RepID=A0A379CA19_9PAST|nr:ShlB/FhaC/HecB family hemolysin secretion/activation protein [Phocoenobacter uteri]MDG6882427.1 hypothetical protein [Phocoenobacter uteri]SUB58585.1 Uncharacterised protein [Phocoenobacter uteri]